MQVRLGRMEWIVWSGWRDLNSRPLDPQRRAHRYPLCPLVLANALLSVESRLYAAPGDFPCPAVVGGSLARCCHKSLDQ